VSSLILDLTSQSNWLQVYDELREVERVSSIAYKPLPPFAIPFLFDKRILSVKVISLTAKPYWRYAGTLTQSFQIGSGGTNTLLPVADFSRKKLNLNRTELVIFPQYTSNYELVFKAPYWLLDLRLTIWEYTGPESDSTEQLVSLTREDLARVEAKVDALAPE
jgi:hypothetical protein